MMKNRKLVKGIAMAAIAAMSMGMMAGCGGGENKQQEADETYKVGLVQLVQHLIVIPLLLPMVLVSYFWETVYLNQTLIL